MGLRLDCSCCATAHKVCSAEFLRIWFSVCEHWPQKLVVDNVLFASNAFIQIGLHLFWLPTKLDVDMRHTHEAFGSIGHCPCVLALPLQACMLKEIYQGLQPNSSVLGLQGSRVRFRYWAPQANDAPPQTKRLKPNRYSAALLFGKKGVFSLDSSYIPIISYLILSDHSCQELNTTRPRELIWLCRVGYLTTSTYFNQPQDITPCLRRRRPVFQPGFSQGDFKEPKKAPKCFKIFPLIFSWK